MPKKTVPLTDVAIRNAKAADKPVKLFDGAGHFFSISPTGASSGGSTTSTWRPFGRLLPLVSYRVFLSASLHLLSPVLHHRHGVRGISGS